MSATLFTMAHILRNYDSSSLDIYFLSFLLSYLVVLKLFSR